MGSHHNADVESGAPPSRADVNRRRFLGYLVAAPTLVVAAELGRQSVPAAAPQATAQALTVPSPPLVGEYYDILDAIRDAARPTANLVQVKVGRDGVVSFELPRSDNGQGIVTATQMIIAEEMNLNTTDVRVTLSPARPDFVFNQITGGSSTIFSMYTPIRVAAALAHGRLLDAAAAILEQDKGTLTSRLGIITAPNGRSVSFGELTEAAASPVGKAVEVLLKPRRDFRILGKPQNKTDARDIVTGKKVFAADVTVPNALPTVICRGPYLNAKPISVSNLAEVRAMPGVTDVVMVSTGVAVRARTLGQAIDGVNALRVRWDGGSVPGESDETILAKVRATELPLVVPPLLSQSVDGDFVFYFRSNSCLETNTAIADVRPNSVEIWAPSKTPIYAQEKIALDLGMPIQSVKFNVMQGGGSYGRRLFDDVAHEAVEISKKIGKPVKLIWSRADDSRVGRTHPMATTRVRATVAAGSVASFELRHTGVATEVCQGLGEIITGTATTQFPAGQYSLAQGVYMITQANPYNVGAVTSLLNESDFRFNTTAMRNVYSPDVATARELMIDKLAAKLNVDPYEFRARLLKLDRFRTVLDRVASEAQWGKAMPAGTAQGIAVQQEYKGFAACVVELDCRPATVNRQVPMARTGPRVTKVTMVVDGGLIINPRGFEAQMMGGINDGIAMTLTSGLHLKDGHFVEASWDNYFYTRQWNTPLEMKIVVLDRPDAEEPGGAGELAVGPTAAAVACAYARATGTMPKYFPIMHKDPLPFEPYPTVPPIPPSPTNGLDVAQ